MTLSSWKYAALLLGLGISVTVAAACSSSDDGDTPAPLQNDGGAGDDDGGAGVDLFGDGAPGSNILCVVTASDGGMVEIHGGQTACVDGNDQYCPTENFGGTLLLPGCLPGASITRFPCPHTVNTTTPGYETCDSKSQVCLQIGSNADAGDGVFTLTATSALCVDVPTGCEKCDCAKSAAAAQYAAMNGDSGACSGAHLDICSYPERDLVLPLIECASNPITAGGDDDASATNSDAGD